MAVPKKRRSKLKVNMHKTSAYYNMQKFYAYRKGNKKEGEEVLKMKEMKQLEQLA